MKDIFFIKNKKVLKISNDLKKEIINLFPDTLKEIILYGSYARAEQNKESDVDFMILLDTDDDKLRKARYKIADIMSELSMKNDIFISITEENYKRYNDYLEALPFYKNIYNEGIRIYGK
jgi:uncharacterized protein